MDLLNSAIGTVFENATVAGIPLLALVLGLTQWTKETFSITGKKVQIVSMLLGFSFGLGYQLTVGFPTDFGGWFGLCVFGLGLGLTASGIYDAAEQVFSPK